jgi:hypothetical protein
MPYLAPPDPSILSQCRYDLDMVNYHPGGEDEAAARSPGCKDNRRFNGGTNPMGWCLFACGTIPPFGRRCRG